MRILTNPTELVPRALEAVIVNDPATIVAAARKYVGEYDFEMLGTGIFFSELGLQKEAAWLLENACIDGVGEKDQDPLIQYHLAFFNSQLGDQAKSAVFLSKAASNNRDYIFASRPETVDALQYAVKINPGDALAHYQLGNLFGNFGRLDEAAGEWESAVKINPALSVPWRNLGWYYRAVRNDRGRSELCFRNAVKDRPYDQTLYRDLAGVLVEEGKRPEAITLLKNMPLRGVRRSDITIDLAQACLESGRYDESIKILMSTPYFVNWEGSSLTWFIFNQSHIRKGIDLFNQGKYKEALADFDASLTFPENLGVGKSSWNGVAEGWYWKGKALQAMGRTAEAAMAWKTGGTLSNGSERLNSYENLCRMMERQAIDDRR
jgi:tetratricopeptide (TPR) repeat protein